MTTTEPATSSVDEAERDFVVSGDGHVLEPTDLFKTRLPVHLRDRAVWEEEFELEEPWVEDGARVFRRLHTAGYEGWTVSRYRQTGGRMPEGDPECILEDMALDGVDVQVMHPNLSLFGLYSDDHELSMAHARVYNDYIVERFSEHFRPARVHRPDPADRCGGGGRRDRAGGGQRLSGPRFCRPHRLATTTPATLTRCGRRSAPRAFSPSSTPRPVACGWTTRRRSPSRSCSRTRRR